MPGNPLVILKHSFCPSLVCCACSSQPIPTFSPRTPAWHLWFFAPGFPGALCRPAQPSSAHCSSEHQRASAPPISEGKSRFPSSSWQGTAKILLLDVKQLRSADSQAPPPLYCTQNLNLRNTCMWFSPVKSSVSDTQTKLLCLKSQAKQWLCF